MQVESVHERIPVSALFDGRGGVKPLRARFAGRDYRIERVTFDWATREGAYPVRHFTAKTSDGDVLKLSLCLPDLVWWLEEIQMSG